jgi:hypothetical protein
MSKEVIIGRRTISAFRFFTIFEVLTTVVAHATYTKRCVSYKRKPAAQIAHLVFADTQANAEKTKRAIFCQRSTEKYRN